MVPIRTTVEPERDRAWVIAECLRIVRVDCPDLEPPARRLFARIQPPRWELEWELPRWLGAAFGLSDRVVTDIVVSTVLGLGSIRLQDDLVDGDVPPGEIDGARLLQAVLFDAALERYRAMFGVGSPFWAEVDRRMQQWHAATQGSGPGDAGAGRPVPDAGHLATRGAPLHVSAYAVCLAADRPDLYAALGRSLDHLLEAQVLYDHVVDWEADLDAGRWNAFVAALSRGPDGPADRERCRIAVRVSLMTSRDADAYFAGIGDQLSRASDDAERLPIPVPRLVEHLRSMATQFDVHAAAYREHYRELGDRAARLLVQ